MHPFESCELLLWWILSWRSNACNSTWQPSQIGDIGVCTTQLIKVKGKRFIALKKPIVKKLSF